MLRAFASLSRSYTGRARDERPGSPTAAPPRWGPEVLYPYASPPYALVILPGDRTTVTLTCLREYAPTLPEAVRRFCTTDKAAHPAAAPRGYDAGMRYAIAIPQNFPDGSFSPDGFRSYFARVEELGVYESAWIQDSTLSAAPTLAPLEAMTYAAACTTTLRLGCTVFVTTLRNPLLFAKAIATLDQMSGGRVEVG